MKEGTGSKVLWAVGRALAFILSVNTPGSFQPCCSLCLEHSSGSSCALAKEGLSSVVQPPPSALHH